MKANTAKNTAPLTSVTNAVSGSGMDRKIATNVSPKKKWLSLIVIMLIVVFAVYMVASKSTGKVLSVDNSRIVVSTVTSGVFEDFIPIRGRITPAKTVYLDAVEGGRVERILVEDGASLATGNLIVELSNASLQLSVLGNETRGSRAAK